MLVYEKYLIKLSKYLLFSLLKRTCTLSESILKVSRNTGCTSVSIGYYSVASFFFSFVCLNYVYQDSNVSLLECCFKHQPILAFKRFECLVIFSGV